jgi:hypothetical protein
VNYANLAAGISFWAKSPSLMQSAIFPVREHLEEVLWGHLPERASYSKNRELVCSQRTETRRPIRSSLEKQRAYTPAQYYLINFNTAIATFTGVE